MRARTDGFVPAPETIRDALADATGADLVFFVRQCLERGAFDHALALAEALPERAAREPALGLSLAVARFLGGEKAEARATVAELVAERPADLNALSVLAEIDARSGDRTSAVRTFTRLVELYPDYPGAQSTLAALLMPGPPYRDVLRNIHAALRPERYLEIGVAAGATLALAATARVAVGVDPVAAPLEHVLPAGAQVLNETSDAFFAKHTRDQLFGTGPVDLVFIDGLHLFEQALRDFVHAERWCGRESTIVFHDCVPITRATASRDRSTRFWVGDTWKAAWALARRRPDLRLRTLLTPPSGLVVVRRLDPTSTRLEDEFDAVVAELAPLAYPHAPGEWPESLHVVPNTPAGLAEALG
ncbi:MAG TPA: class I SAM-dependent methyltransferase [Polyangiaceae bacterium]|nr:class I SAM-dependent methyltransferase [Polyangiaceae bacterium]